MSDLSWNGGPFGWRRLTQALWTLERGFKRALVADKTEGETRLRIFFLLALFATAFVFLAVGATRCALFSDAGKTGAYIAPTGAARADLVDRNGNLLAIDLTHYGVYVDPREIWDTAETQRVLAPALPALQAGRLEKALTSDHREYLVSDLIIQIFME